jgi:Spy/CpxP family protein refolding chaperone
MSPRYVFALIAAVAALGGAVAIANPSVLRLPSIAQAPTVAPDSRPPRPDEPGWLEDLNLGADQVRQMRAIRSQYKDKISQGRQNVRQAQQELRELMAGTASEAELRTKYSQVKTLKQQVGDIQFESMLATRKVLNAEQRRTFANRVMKRRQGDDRKPERLQPPQS